VLSRQVAELGLDIDDKRRVIDSYELRGFVHAHRTQFERALDHWRSLDEDLRPARPEPSEALEAAQLRLVEMQPRAEIAKVELAQLLRQDLAARDRLNSLVLAEANREADAAIEVLKTTIAAAAPAMTEIGKQARLIRSNFPQRADEALRLVDGARQLTW
jgi:hypothetical protein